jgi:hypothetical protein
MGSVIHELRGAAVQSSLDVQHPSVMHHVCEVAALRRAKRAEPSI